MSAGWKDKEGHTTKEENTIKEKVDGKSLILLVLLALEKASKMLSKEGERYWKDSHTDTSFICIETKSWQGNLSYRDFIKHKGKLIKISTKTDLLALNQTLDEREARNKRNSLH